MNISLHLNLEQNDLLETLKSINVPDVIKEKITVTNSRVEFQETENNLFMIFIFLSTIKPLAPLIR